jgi:hypothetical protein
MKLGTIALLLATLAGSAAVATDRSAAIPGRGSGSTDNVDQKKVGAL